MAKAELITFERIEKAILLFQLTKRGFEDWRSQFATSNPAAKMGMATGVIFGGSTK